MAQVSWIRVAIAAAIMLAILAAVTYWQAQNNPVNDTDIDLMLQGCIVRFFPDGSSEIIKFGDSRCP
jgi:hypothetical protein